MKLLILGATGRTGRLLLENALGQGYEVNCLVRDKSKVIIQHQNLQLFEGHPTNLQALTEAISNCSVVLSALNVSRTSDFPWARLRTPKTLLSDTMRHIISLSNDHNFKRVIICSAWGVGETKAHLPGWFNWFIDNSNIGVAYQDHERQEALLMKSTLDWTFVRPSGLINSKKVRRVIESYDNQPKPKLLISRASVAQYMVDAIKNDSLIKKAPSISNQ